MKFHIITITTIVIITILLGNSFSDSLPQASAAYENTPLSAPYKKTKLSTREEGLEIKGFKPVMPNINSLGTVLNECIDDTYRQKIIAAKESKARSINFECEYYESLNGISSILLKTSITTAVTKDEVNSFNFSQRESRLIGVNDILGPNGLQIANKVISQRIRSDSELYYANFPGLNDTDAFHITPDGYIVFSFDAFKIAPGSVGITTFPLKIDNITNTKPVKKGDGYWVKDESYSLKMVSLRAVCDDLHYSINWSEPKKAIYVSRPGDVTVSFKINENSYLCSRTDVPDKNQLRQVSLESEPVMINGITYVPISFFDQILELVAYHVESNDSIIFTTYSE